MFRGSIPYLITLSLLTFLLIGLSAWFSPKQNVAEAPVRIFYVATNGDDAADGMLEHPWATLHHAADVLRPGDAVYVRAGTYPISQRIQPKHSGQANAWIIYAAFPGERVVIDAGAIEVPPPAGQPPFPHDQGAFLLDNVRYIQVRNLEIINSRSAGFTVRHSHHVDLYNNKTENTFASGIGIWNGHHHKILGNTVINANTPELAFAGFPDQAEAPHEAISIGGVKHFEVAYNLVQDGKKEGIDVKETSQSGTVHHNYVHHMKRQGLYVDSWGGLLEKIEVFHNVVHDCEGAGFALSVEGGRGARRISVHHNLLYDNWGTGIFFSRWGNDGLRKQIKIHHNTIHHNGYGKPDPGESFYWLTGGLYLFSDRLEQIEIQNNIFSENIGFQIGYSDRYLNHSNNSSSIEAVFQKKQIRITDNLIFGPNNTEQSIYAGWTNNYANIYPVNGESFIEGDPQYVDPKAGNFYLQKGSPAIRNSLQSGDEGLEAGNLETIGAFPVGAEADFWWQNQFPPPFHSPHL